MRDVAWSVSFALAAGSLPVHAKDNPQATTTAVSASITDEQREAAIREIGAAIESMTEAWRRADFIAASRWMVDGGWITFNGHRSTMKEAADQIKEDPDGGYGGQYIAGFDVRYDVLSPDVVVTTWENDFARITPDGTQQPTEVALMTLVWLHTDDGWIIRHYHESTRPKGDED